MIDKRCYVCKKSTLREDGTLDRNSCQGSNPCNTIRDFELIDDKIIIRKKSERKRLSRK